MGLLNKAVEIFKRCTHSSSQLPEEEEVSPGLQEAKGIRCC